ncbi:acylphosphatase [Hyphomicrobium sp.]|uniref:acylphosphatase n=1 Tax=Hyphomicrobium sp. TaxID=82 RepID=UPI000FB82C64|nr:acylphosphatase [Hyphomicrobium sp.]RUP07828.1 MAG: acylphosphatase [Hyphomicrobium sp.]
MSVVRTVHVRIEGRVQGVGYRAWVESTARTMALTGWVRNRRDRSVEITLQGPANQVDEMLSLCKQGPPGAHVTKVEIRGEGLGAYDGFDVLPTT